MDDDGRIDDGATVGDVFELHPGERPSIDLSDPAAVAAARRFKATLGRFGSGITVVTAMAPDGHPVGMTCQSFSSVSLSPPLVLFSPARTSRAWPLIRQAGVFCVNILAEDQEWLSTRFATRGIDKFAGIEWTPAEKTGSPVLPGTLGHVDCTVDAVHPAGDHDLALGLVQHLAVSEERKRPLLYYRGDYRRLD